MPTPPQQNHRITLAEAAAYTAGFRAANPGAILASMYWNSGGISDLMAQPGCAGIRIYYGLDDKGVAVMVIVAVDAQGSDMTAGVLLEVGLPCPPFCGNASPLRG